MSTPTLPLRPLGHTRLRVPTLCIGAAALGNMPEAFAYEVAESQALATIRAVFTGPIPFLDTAAIYGDGESERRIGVVVREMGGLPDGFVLATKADRDPRTNDFSAGMIRRSVERSLQLLGLEKLQLVYLHDPENGDFSQLTGPGGAVEALRRCQEEGLIDHLGVAGGPIGLLIRYAELGIFEAVISHNRYTLLNTSANPLWDLCRERNIAAVNAAPYGSGILAKGTADSPRYAYQSAEGELLERARALEAICARYGAPLGAAALQFSLRDPRITSTIVGITQPERLAGTVAWAEYPIPDACWEELGTITPTTEDPEEHRWGS
ncbi:MAG TPA: aldo/keto reductase [Chloroflexota bacterium]|nr:aldo/keto reductase [Chloroflexota bacterium]